MFGLLSKKSSSRLHALAVTACCATATLFASNANAGVELQSFQVEGYPHHLDAGHWIAIRFTYIENDEPQEPLLLDLGDGSPPVDLLQISDQTPDPFSNLHGLGHPDPVIDVDLSRYTVRTRRINHVFPASMTSTTISLIGGSSVRHDALNHDGEKVQYSMNLDLTLDHSRQKEVRRGEDIDVFTLVAGKKHSYDLPKLLPEYVKDQRCRLMTKEESGIAAVPHIGTERLRVTEDCKLQFDATHARVGDRYIFQYKSTSPLGHEWVTMQTIQIVEDLESICELTDASLYTPAFPENPYERSDIRVRIGRGADGRYSRQLQSGGPPLDGWSGFGSSSPGLPALWTDYAAFVNVQRQITGTFLATHTTEYLEELPVIESTLCPVEFEIGCKGRPELDSDGDGVCDLADNCPDLGSSRDQNDLDADGMGDLCDLDRDGDGVPNTEDRCPDSNGAEATNARGCSVHDLCPCPTSVWDFETKTQCTRRVSLRFLSLGRITRAQRQTLIDEAQDNRCPEVESDIWQDLFWWWL